jgi:hypothetical protein
MMRLVVTPFQPGARGHGTLISVEIDLHLEITACLCVEILLLQGSSENMGRQDWMTSLSKLVSSFSKALLLLK